MLAALEKLKPATAEVEPAEIPDILGALRALEARLLARLVVPTPPEPAQRGDRLLTFKEAAARLACSIEYLYHHPELPFVRRTDYGPRVSEKALQAYINNPSLPTFSGGPMERK